MKKVSTIRFRFYIILFTILFLNGTVKSTVLEKMNTEKLAKKAHTIIIGNVIDIKHEWDDQWKLIFTFVTISVEQYIKGDQSKKEIQVIYPGGKIGSKQLLVDGTPEFYIGEKVFLFLEPEIKNSLRVVGWYQGKNSIINDQVAGKNKSLHVFLDEVKKILDQE